MGNLYSKLARGGGLGAEEEKEWSCVSAEEVPELMRCPHIDKGYRPSGSLSWSQVAGSLWRAHNETGNVWTHLLPAPYFAYETLRVLLSDARGFDRRSDRLAFAGFTASAAALLGASSAFHLGCCKDPAAFRTLQLCDYEGINLLMSGMYLPGVWFSHGQLHPRTALAYFAVVALVGLRVSGTNWARRNRSAEGRGRVRKLLALEGTWGVLVVAHFVAKHWAGRGGGGGTPPQVRQFLRAVGGMWGAFGVGFLFFLSGFPECCAPGKFDLVGHSHQWWHVCCVAGCGWWTREMRKLNAMNMAMRMRMRPKIIK